MAPLNTYLLLLVVAALVLADVSARSDKAHSKGSSRHAKSRSSASARDDASARSYCLNGFQLTWGPDKCYDSTIDDMMESFQEALSRRDSRESLARMAENAVKSVRDALESDEGKELMSRMEDAVSRSGGMESLARMAMDSIKMDFNLYGGDLMKYAVICFNGRKVHVNTC